MKTLTIATHNKIELLDITKEIGGEIDKDTKVVLVFIPHATAGVLINENEENLKADFVGFLGKISSLGPFQHNKIDNNASSHFGASFIGQSVVLPTESGRLKLGTWQRIFLVELDGPRERKVIIEKI
jgi:secondary thiamine-phosphate synthase enzyme